MLLAHILRQVAGTHSLGKGSAVVRLCGKMDEDAVRKAIAEEDYELLEVQMQTT
jgi:hypothetical protein